MIFALNPSTSPTFKLSRQFPTLYTLKPQRVKKLEEMSGSSSVVMFYVGFLKMWRYIDIFKYSHKLHLDKKKGVKESR